MTDFRETIKKDKGFLENLLHQVPGFGGYLDREDRRESDKLLRDHLVRRVEQLRGKLDGFIRELTDSGGLALTGQIDSVKKGLEKISSKLTYAVRGYSGFLDAVKVDTETLDRLYEFDASLVERIEVLEKSISGIGNAASDAGALKEEVQSAKDLILQFDEHLDGRTGILKGAGSAS